MKGSMVKKISIGLLTAIIGLSNPAGVVPGTTVTVEAAAKPSLNKKSITLKMGANYTLSLKNAGNSKVTWSTSKKSVATVTANGSKAVVYGKTPGKATVTAKIGKKAYKCSVKVVPAPKISKSSITLEVGKTYDLSVTGTTSSPKWSTSKKSVATIKKISARKYRVKAVKAGTSTITAKVNGKTLKCKVTVKAAQKPAATGYPKNKYGYTLSKNGQPTSADQYIMANGQFDPKAVTYIEGYDDARYKVGNLMFYLQLNEENVQYINFNEPDYDKYIRLALWTWDNRYPQCTKEEASNVYINGNDIKVTIGSPDVVAAKVLDNGLIELIPYSTGESRISVSYRGLTFRGSIYIMEY